jgi:hypothetical protein
LTELAGADEFAPGGIDGISVVPTLLGRGEQRRHECLYWEWRLYNWREKKDEPNGLMQAVRCGNWKLVRHRQDVPWELYDLSVDVGEQEDIAAKHPQVVTRLAKWIEENRTTPRPQLEPPKPEGRRFR